MIVIFPLAVGTNHWCRADENAERGIGSPHSLFEPGLLLFSPDGLFRTIWHRIGTSKVAALNHPDLQIFSPTDRSVSAVAHPNLLPKNSQTLLKRKVAHEQCLLARPTIVHPCIVIILNKITGNLPVKCDIGRQAVHPRPVPARQRQILGPAVVIDDITCMNKKIGIAL